MTQVLTQALIHSSLLRPWVALAAVSSARWKAWLQASVLGVLEKPCAALSGLLVGLRQALRPVAPAAPLMLGLLSVGLLLVLATQSTTIIALATLFNLAVVLLAVFLFADRQPEYRLNSVDVLVVLFFITGVIATAFSSYRMQSLVGLGKMATFFAGYLVFRLGAPLGRGFTLPVMTGLALVGAWQALVGFDQYVSHVEPLATWVDPEINPELNMTRVWGTIQPLNPNLLAGFLAPCLAAAAGLKLYFTQKKTWLLNGVFGLMALAVLGAVVLTGSRGGFLVIAALLVSTFAWAGHVLWHHPGFPFARLWKRLWVIALVAVILAAGAGIAVSPKIQQRVMSMFAMRQDSSISYRLNVYGSAMQIIRDNPVVGIGPGNDTFKQVYGLYMVPGFNALGSYSVPLEIAVEQGLPGLIVFLSLLLVIFFRLAFCLDHPDIELREKWWLLMLFNGVLLSVVYGVFDTIWYRPAVNLLFWLCVAFFAVDSERLLLRHPLPARSGETA
ncbi:MAG: O-antigen ligase family protein [Candidatus Melainabacteria bacterium]